MPFILRWKAEHSVYSPGGETGKQGFRSLAGAAPGQSQDPEGPQAPCTAFSAALTGAPRRGPSPRPPGLTFHLCVGTHCSGVFQVLGHSHKIIC